MDLGVWMRPEVLADKLDARSESNSEQAWNLARWPIALSEPGDHRLFVAVNGAWRGYFKIAGDALYNPDDARTPYTLLFDTKTWTPMTPVAVHRFRGFTYDVPRLDSKTSAD